jgi:hypothetical protein
MGCGKDEVVREKLVPIEQPTPPVTPPVEPPVGGAPSFSQLSKKIEQNCALSGCHAGAPFLQSEAGFLNSRSKVRIGNGTMPPQYSPKFNQWTQADKDLFALYFDSKQ